MSEADDVDPYELAADVDPGDTYRVTGTIGADGQTKVFTEWMDAPEGAEGDAVAVGTVLGVKMRGWKDVDVEVRGDDDG